MLPPETCSDLVPSSVLGAANVSTELVATRVSVEAANVATEDLPAEQFHQWLLEAKQGSEVALGRLLWAAHRYLLRIANETLSEALRGKTGASDLVQDTALEAYQDFRTFQGERYEELLHWLRGILLHNVANSNRHFERVQKRDVSREVALIDGYVVGRHLVSSYQTASDCLIAIEQTEAVEMAVLQLPADMRSAVLLRNREHLSFSDIGVRLNRSADAARKLWARAVEQLQDQLVSAN